MRTLRLRSPGWSLVLAAAAWLGTAAARLGGGDPLVIDAPLWSRPVETAPWYMTRPGERLPEGSRARAGAVPAGWHYDDGAEVRLTPASNALLMLNGSDSAVIELIQGTLWWNGGTGERTVVIAVGGSSVVAGGGDEILVEMAPNGVAALGVLRGGARVTTGEAAEGDSTIVREGQRTLVRPGERPESPSGYNVEADREAYFPAEGPPFLGTTLDRLVKGISPLGPAAVHYPARPTGAARGTEVLRVVALTFDDGPIRTITPRILDTLRALGLKATFFVVGQRVEASPDLLRRIVEEGHSLGNHTYTHAYLDRLGDAAVLEQVLRCQQAVDRALGHPYPMALVRPPYGATNARVRKVLRDTGYTLVGWNVDSRDYATRRKGAILSTILRQVPFKGGIVLMHDHVAALPQTLPDLVGDLKARGYAILQDQTHLLAGGLPRLPGEPRVFHSGRHYFTHAALEVPELHAARP